MRVETGAIKAAVASAGAHAGALDAELQSLLARHSRDLSTDDWARVVDIVADPALADRPRAFEGVKLLSHLATEASEGRYHGSVQSYFERARVARMGDDQVARAVDELLERAPDGNTPDDWARLLALLGDPRGKPLVPGTLQPLRPLTGYVGSMADGAPADAGLLGYLQQRAVARLDDDAVQREFLERFTRGREGLDGRDWMRLAALADDPRTPEVGRIAGLGGEFNFYARKAGNGSTIHGPALDAYFGQTLLRHSPEHVARVDGAIARLVEGAADPNDLKLLRSHWAQLDELLAGRSGGERLAIATTMLDAEMASQDQLRDTLRATLSALDDASPSSKAATLLRAETQELLERNIARLEGRAPDSPAVDDLHYPDYADLGRIRANLSLIQSLQVAVGDTFVW